MGRNSKDNAQRIGPKLWAHFLKRHFRCLNLAPLNAQLLLPITPYEVFEFGENPAPLPPRLAPKIFERAHDLGRSPDGVYTPEIYGADDNSGKIARFNLYERVSQRVPESKYWLLKEIEYFLQAIPPPIDTTVRVLNELLSDLALRLVEGEAIAAWESLDHASLEKAQMSAIEALTGAQLPEYVALAYSLCHVCVWLEPPRYGDKLSSNLLSWCFKATENFVSFLESQNFDFDKKLSSDLLEALDGGVFQIGLHGWRSMNLNSRMQPPNLSGRLVIVPDTETTREAICCLSDAVEFQSGLQLAWPEYDASIVERYERYGFRETELRLDEAVQELAESSAVVPIQLRDRAQRALAGYEYPGLATAASMADRP